MQREFRITSDYIELNKLLKLMDICSSGAAANHMISRGDVRVDGKIETRKRRKISHGRDVAAAGVRILII